MTVNVNGVNFLIYPEKGIAKVFSTRESLLKEAIIPAQFSHNGRTYRVTEIESFAFDRSQYLRTVSIPNTVTKIGSAFHDCTNLSSIIIPESVVELEIGGFTRTNIRSIVIPKNVAKIGLFNFFECNSLISIKVDKNNPVYDSRENCNAIIMTEKNILVASCQNTVIPSSVTTLGYMAFSGCPNLKTINIPMSVKVIGEECFDCCKSLETIKIPNSVEAIYPKAFFKCESLINVVMSDNVKLIEEETFACCYNLKNIMLGESIERIDDGAFMHCESLSSIKIPDSVTYIGYHAFFGCDSLTSITLPKGISKLGDNIFDDCNNLNSIYVPKGMKEKYCRLGLEKYRFLVREKKDKSLEKKSIQTLKKDELKLAELSYKEMLRTEQWQTKRNRILLRDGYECTMCGETENLNVHHKYYIENHMPWEYHDSALITLCRDCHCDIHHEKEIPVYNLSPIDNPSAIIVKKESCDRCDGKGILPEYMHIMDGICFCCWGSGYKELYWHKGARVTDRVKRKKNI